MSPYTEQDVRNMLGQKVKVVCENLYNQVGTQYLIPPSTVWVACREGVFGLSYPEWKKDIKKEEAAKRFHFYFAIKSSLLPEPTRRENIIARVTSVTKELYAVEEYLKFARHTLEFAGIGTVPKHLEAALGRPGAAPFNYSHSWKIDVSNRWRFSPTTFYLLLSLLRQDYTLETFKDLEEVKLIKEYGVRAVFGNSILSRLKKGEGFTSNHGNVHFRQRLMTGVRTRLEKEKKENKAKRKSKKAS